MQAGLTRSCCATSAAVGGEQYSVPRSNLRRWVCHGGGFRSVGQGAAALCLRRQGYSLPNSYFQASPPFLGALHVSLPPPLLSPPRPPPPHLEVSPL